VAIAITKDTGGTLNELAKGLSALQGVENFSLSHARN